MNVWILQTGEPLHIDEGSLRPMRAMNLADALVERGHRVTIWSSDFDHFTKKHRFRKDEVITVHDNLEIRLIHSRGYQNHFGLDRLFDHAQMGWNLKKLLRGESVPDVAFLGYPPIEPAWVMSLWLKRRGVPFYVDVKDAWPEILVRALPKSLQTAGKILLLPYLLAMKSTFKNATALSSISEPYLNWCRSKIDNEYRKFDRITPLTSQVIQYSHTELEESRIKLDQLDVTDDGEFRMSFIGTLNSAFDFGSIISAAKSLGFNLVIAGDGPQLIDLKKICIDHKNIKFLGWISGAESRTLMERTSIMVAPLKDLPDFRMSMPNKFFDAMQNGKSMLTSISGFTGAFIQKNEIGFEYPANDEFQTTRIISELMSYPQKLLDQGERALEIYNEEFSFQKVYSQLIDDLEKIR
jgi:glycosyltransferase involved in cell wall biosynthesis